MKKKLLLKACYHCMAVILILFIAISLSTIAQDKPVSKKNETRISSKQVFMKGQNQYKNPLFQNKNNNTDIILNYSSSYSKGTSTGITGGTQIRATGDDCTDPINVSLPSDLPYTDANQTTCGRGNNYSSTCLRSYGQGEDIIYKITVTSNVTVDITLDPKTTTYTGICIDNVCPPGSPCMSSSISLSATPHGLTNVALTNTGSPYYIMVDKQPKPICITDFDLTINCLDPSNLTTTNITHEEANLGWTENCAATTWDIEWDTSGFTQGNGTTVSSVTSNPYNLTSLTAGTTFDWYVRSNYGGNYSGWSGPETFITKTYYSNGSGNGGGYYYANSEATGAPSYPTYSWIDISGTGTDVIGSLNDDNVIGPFNIGFAFTFFGNDYTQFYISSNGWISFEAFTGTTYQNFTNTQLPNATVPNNIVALFWDDLNPDDGSVTDKHVYYGADGSGDMVISFVNYPEFGADVNGWITAQVILYNDVSVGNDRVFFQFKDHGSSIDLNGSTVGIENLLGTKGFQYRYNGSGGPLFTTTRAPLAMASGPDENVLPVELFSFNASVNKSDVTLNWITAWESNNAGFDIERQSLANKKDIWTKIGYVEGYGTTNEPKNYSFQDRKLKSGKYNYRLVQRDYNNRGIEHFLSDEVTVGVPTKYDISQNYPNPFNPTTKIDYDLPYDGKVNIVLYDITGREIAKIVNEIHTAGYYTAEFNASYLASGVYFYRIIAKGGKNDFIMTKKMLLIK